MKGSKRKRREKGHGFERQWTDQHIVLCLEPGQCFHSGTCKTSSGNLFNPTQIVLVVC